LNRHGHCTQLPARDGPATRAASVLKGRRIILTGPHFALGSQPTGDRTRGAPSNTDPGIATLVASVMEHHAFAVVDLAEDEIARAIRRHPDDGDALCHSFGLIRPRDIGPGMGSEFIYRSHAAELLDRVAAGADTRPATAAELCLICCEASLRTPLHGPTAGVYFRMWLRAFPDRPITAGLADAQVHYEQLYGVQIDDLERTLREKAADPRRQLGEIECAGKHHGMRVACRYATTPPAPAPAVVDHVIAHRRATR